VKKVKLSKEEKKALKKEKKRRRAEEEAAAEVSHVSLHSVPPNPRVAERISKGEGEKGEEEGREGQGKEGKEEQTLMTTTLLTHLLRPSLSSFSPTISSCLCISVNYAQCM
jgi:hypothetical protein